MKSLITLIKIIVAAALIIAAVIAGKSQGMLDVPRLVYVLLGMVAMTLMGFTRSDITAAFKHGAGRPGGEKELRISMHFWEAAARNAWMLGVLGTIISFIFALSQASEGIGDIAARMASAFITSIYGMILGAVFLIPAFKSMAQLSALPPSEKSDVPASSDNYSAPGLKSENIIGYILFALVLGWIILYPLLDKTMGGPLNPAQVFIYWPSLLIVAGGAIAMVLFIGETGAGRPISLCLALTGIIGSLIGLVQVLISFSGRSIKGVAAAVTFVISCSFISLVGMMLIGIPMEDRAVKYLDRKKPLTITRLAWFLVPLTALIFLVLTFILVITPIRKVVE